MIPPEADAAFVAAMEDVLEVYARPYDPARPLVCFDEASKQNRSFVTANEAQVQRKLLTRKRRRPSQAVDCLRMIVRVHELGPR